MDRKFTTISELGEFNLIERITKDVVIKNKSTKMGIGDDAAIINQSQNFLVSTDMLIEGVHFDPTYTPLKHLGYKSIVVNMSDICAMGGQSRQALVSLGVPNKYSVENIEELYSGVIQACNNYGVDLVGGDTTSSSSGLVISVTMIGGAVKKDIIHRSGAKVNELIYVSGNLGAAYLGLQILEREKMIFDKNQEIQPDLNPYSYILERQLKPEARIDILREIQANNIPITSMIDISDGLSSDLKHICQASGVGAKLFEQKIPVSSLARQTAKELNIDPMICALHGGEDYELLFTAPPSAHEKMIKIKDISPIGHIISKENQIELTNNKGGITKLDPSGWESFRGK